MHRKIGIIGGMGPLATAKLFQLIVQHTKTETDKGHIHVFIDNNPQIPDRTEAILNHGESPLPALCKSALSLEKTGADFLIMPCNTAHVFLDRVQEAVHIPILNMIDLTASHLAQLGVSSAGLLATSGTVRTGLYEKFNLRHGVATLLPDETGQQAVMDYIYHVVKAGRTDYDAAPLQKVMADLRKRGAQKIILGCTELSTGINHLFPDDLCVNALEILADSAILYAGYELKAGVRPAAVLRP